MHKITNDIMVSKLSSRRHLNLCMPVLCCLICQCLMPDVFAADIPVSGVIAPNPEDRLLQAQLSTKDDNLPIASSADASVDASPPAHAPLKVTIPDISALQQPGHNCQMGESPAPAATVPPATPTVSAAITPEAIPEKLAQLAPAAGKDDTTLATPPIPDPTPSPLPDSTVPLLPVTSSPDQTPAQASTVGLPPGVPEYAIKRWTGPDAIQLDQPAESALPLMPPPVTAHIPENAIKRWTGPDAIRLDQPAENEVPVSASPAPEPKAAAADSKQPPAQPPAQEISPESKKILESLPAHPAPAKTVDSTPVAIDHSKKTAVLDKKPDTTVDAKSQEAMGIKIDVKTPKINVDYELEKAYNAAIAGRSDAAIILYKNVLEVDPNNKNALFGLATTYHRAGQLDQARPLYAKLLSIDPNHRDGLNNFLVLLADEAPEDALGQLKKLQETNPTFSPIPAQMAIICQKLGLTDQALENMSHAIELSPENLTYRYNFAIMLDKQHKYDEAAKFYQQIVQAYQRGEVTPGNIQKIQQRLTFISSNKP